jgi:uncharacterized membrane protein
LNWWARGIEAVKHAPRRYLGVGFAVILWIVLELFGFLATFLLCLLMLIGYAVGRFFDDREQTLDMLRRFWDRDHL